MGSSHLVILKLININNNNEVIDYEINAWVMVKWFDYLYSNKATLFYKGIESRS
jgi:hypothetical protein